MGVIVRQGFKSTLVSYVGVAIGAINQLVLATEYLTPTEIGLRELLLSTSMALTIIGQLSIQHVMSRFFTYFEDDSRQHNGFLLTSLGVAAIGILLCSALFSVFDVLFFNLFQADRTLISSYEGYIMPLTGILVFHAILETWARLHFRVVANALAREIILRVSLSALIIMYGTSAISFHGFIVGFVSSYFLAVLFLIAYIKYDGRLYLNYRFITIPKGALPEMIKYALWVIIGGAGYIIAERIDGVMLAWLVDLKKTGVYSISFFIASLIEMPRRAIGQLSSTLVAKYWKDKDFDAMQKLYKQVSINQLIMAGLLFIVIWSSIDGLFILMPKGELYAEGKYVVLFIGLSRVLDMFFGINNEVILNSPYYKFSLIAILFLAVVSFSANYFMIPLYGISGAASGTIISMLLFNSLKSTFIRLKFNLKLFTYNSLKAFLLIFGFLLVNAFIPFASESFFAVIAEVFFRTLSITLLYIFAIYQLKLSDDINNYVLLGVNRIKSLF